MKTIYLLLAGIAISASAAEPAAQNAAPAPAAQQPATATPAARPTAPAPAPAAPPSSQSLEPRVDTSAPAAAKPAGTRGVRDRLELETTQITGNRELPRVMYVVPWKRSDLGDLTGRPVNSLLDEVLSPVDRDVFRRQNRYYDALQPDAADRAAAAQ